MSINDLTATATEQLQLIAVPSVRRSAGRPRTRRLPAKLRLDEQTRQIGLAGVAEARALLEAQARRRADLEQRPESSLARRAA